jgi:hypothetical protein
MVREFVLGSSVALILIVTAILEFLLRKFAALRTLYELQNRSFEELEKEIARLREELETLREPAPGETPDDTPKSGPD